jgi:nicotinamidase-related amidase
VKELPIPPHFQPAKVGEVWRVEYAARAAEAKSWAGQHRITPATEDSHRTCVLVIDCQNTFCIPGFELFVGGASGSGAVDDNRRLCEFVYRNLGAITEIVPTMDTHTALQIFHPAFWVNEEGEHPVGGATTISVEDVETGRWRVNPEVARALSGDPAGLDDLALHYVKHLAGRYPLMVWPYHAMLGGVGHALVSAVEEAAFFHGIARRAPTHFEMKGGHPLTENYSALSPEVLEGPTGETIGIKNTALLDRLLAFDTVVVAGQAKSHCVAWTVTDLLNEIEQRDPAFVRRVILLEDCTSPVVIPGVVDFTEQADDAFARFREAGMRVVRSTDRLAS